MSTKKVLQALQTGLIAARDGSTIPTMPLKLLGLSAEISQDKYIEVIFITNNIPNEFWGAGETYRGFLRLMLHWNIDGSGIYPPTEYMQSVCDYFIKGKRLYNDDIIVKVTDNPRITIVDEQPPEILVLAQIEYYCFLKP